MHKGLDLLLRGHAIPAARVCDLQLWCVYVDWYTGTGYGAFSANRLRRYHKGTLHDPRNAKFEKEAGAMKNVGGWKVGASSFHDPNVWMPHVVHELSRHGNK
jgi:hypothetical protein